MIYNKLKTVSVHNLETIIAKAISSFLKDEDEFDSNISNISYHETWDEASFQIKIRKPIKFGQDT
jgi:hypothetical protein